MSAARRYLSRPRTKLYDCQYAMGERAYRGMVDSLDQPRGSRTADTSSYQTSAPTFTKPPPAPTKYRHSADREVSEEDDTIKKIRAARAKMEDEVRTFEEGSNARRAARNNNRVDVSERLLDSVGVSRRSNDTNSEYEFRGSRGRRAVTELEEDPFFTTKTFKKFQFEDDDDEPLPRIKSRSSASRALVESAEDSFDTAAALARAKKSRARMAEIDDEMEQLAQKSKARGARMAAAQAVLKEAAEVESNVSSSTTKSVRVSKRSVQVTERVN